MNNSKYLALLLFAAILIVVGVSSCKVGPDYVKSDFKKSPATFRFGEGTPDSVVNLQ